MRKLFLAAACIFAVGCGSSSSKGSSASNKDLFTTWTATDDSVDLDFSGGTFNVSYPAYFVITAVDEICYCSSLIFSGTQSNGAITIAGCSHASGNNSGMCSMFENGGAAYTYTKNGASLDICDSGGCESYR